MIVQLLAGMFLGCVIASIVWVYTHKSSKNKVDASRREREEIMHSLGELWIGIDKLIAAHRKGNFEAKGFRETFKTKIEAINQLFKPNLHLFDVYYVKYTENLIAEYNRAVLKGEMPIDRIATSSDVELETNYTIVEQPATITTTASSVDDTKESVTPESAVPVVVPAAPETDFLSKDEPVDRAGATHDFEIVVEEKDIPKAAEADLFELSVVDEKTAVSVEIREASRAVIDIPEVKSEPEEVFNFEAVKAPEQEFNLEMVVEKEPEAALPPPVVAVPVEEEISFEKATDKPAEITQKSDKVAFEADAAKKTTSAQKAGKAADPFDEEDFSMETLIDVDINTISPFLKKEAAAKKASKPKPEEQHHLFEVSSGKNAPAQEAASLEIVIAPNAGHSKAPVQKNAFSEKNKGKSGVAEKSVEAIPEETTLTRADEMRGRGKKSTSAAPVKKDEDLEAVFELKTREQSPAVPPRPASGGVSPADIELFDKEEAIITGDDVADKIAALEFAKPSSSANPPVKKEKERDADNVKPVVGAVQPPTPKTAVPAPALKGSAAATSKTKVHDDTITGDDVASKIDSFFGLFEK